MRRSASSSSGWRYVTIDAHGEDGWQALKERMRDGVIRAFYFSVAPSLFGVLAERLHQHGDRR